jgi:hypothetical protein
VDDYQYGCIGGTNLLAGVLTWVMIDMCLANMPLQWLLLPLGHNSC